LIGRHSNVSQQRARAPQRRAHVAVALLCALGSASADSPSGLASSSVAIDAAAAKKHWSTIEKFCFECHNVDDFAGGVSFDVMSPEQIPADAKVWEHAVRKLRGRMMPPPGNKQPEQATIQQLIVWLESTLDAAARQHPQPGRVALHRLNRKEYANAVQDLLGLKVDATALLPTDDTSEGFDNVAQALQVSPSFLDQYLNAARYVAAQAIGDPASKPLGASYVAKGAGTQQTHREGLPLGTRGGMVVEHFFPADGEYRINIGNLAVALWVYNMEFQHTLIVTVDGRKVYETSIGGEADQKAIDQQQDPAVEAVNARLKNIRFKATAGPHKVAVTFLHRSFAESEDRLHAFVPGGGQDRVLRINSFEIRGPFGATGVSATPSRNRIFLCYPASRQEEQRCSERIIAALAHRAFRRPVTDEDLQPIRTFYRAGRDNGNFDSGIRRAVTAILADPNFLYRSERVPQKLAHGTTYRITDIELASRLSFFLWSSLPDDELLAVAEAGRLHEPEILRRQTKRMLADSRSLMLTTSFAFQWLNVAKLSEIEPDAGVFPYAARGRDIDGDVREAFRTELKLFIDSIFREDRSVVELLTADHTYLNERLALHYGINTIRGDRFRRVVLQESTRYGLLGKGGVLMLTSYPNRTAPVLRGAWILENITGTPIPQPPPNVEALKENASGKKARTVRQLMAQHSVKKTCHACHGVMDPLGFALENFDATGQWRVIDRFARVPIDASGVLPDGANIDGPDDLRKALTRQPDQFVQTFTEKLLTYALGRTIDYRDMPAVRAIVRNAAQDNYRFSSLVTSIVEGESFSLRQVDVSTQHTTATR